MSTSPPGPPLKPGQGPRRTPIQSIGHLGKHAIKWIQSTTLLSWASSFINSLRPARAGKQATIHKMETRVQTPTTEKVRTVSPEPERKYPKENEVLNKIASDMESKKLFKPGQWDHYKLLSDSQIKEKIIFLRGQIADEKSKYLYSEMPVAIRRFFDETEKKLNELG